MNNFSFRQLLQTLVAVLFLGIGGMAHSVEEPEHTLVGKIGNVEIRTYQPVIQAITPLPSSAHTSDGFRRLAGFIFGGNDSQQKIAMTAPVQETLGVAQPELAFTMPRGYSLDSLPDPSDPGVRLVEVPERTVAVIKFSGWATSRKIRHYTHQLLEALASREIDASSKPMLNQYNPPWTAPFLRRNEIMVEINTSGSEMDRRLASFVAEEQIYTF